MYRYIKISYINKLAILLVAFLVLMMVSACNTAASDFTREIDHISEVMSEVPRQEEICFDMRSFSEFGEDGFAFYDDWYNYYYDKAGYLATAVLLSDRLTAVYDKNVPEKKPDKVEINNGVEERALQMHMTNLKMWLAQDRDIKTSVGGMGETIITINELYEGKPKGVSSSVTFAKDGSLISLATYCKPVDERKLANSDEVTLEEATNISYNDVFGRYKEVLLPMDLLDLKCTAERSTFERNPAWKISISGLVRTDFPKALQEIGWSVSYYISSESGEILGRLEAS